MNTRWAREAKSASGFGLVAVIGLGLWLALTIVVGPVWGFVPMGVVLALLILSNPTVRLAFVVFGALLTLQSSQELSLTKLAYLAGVVLALGAALFSLRNHPGEQTTKLLTASLLIFALVGISLAVSLLHGNDILLWLRDAASYLLLGCIPVIAADAAATLQRQTVMAIFIVTGLLSALSFALVWAFNHHVIALPIDRLLYSSLMPASALVAYAFTRAFAGGKHSLRWLGVASLVVALVLLTGTRNTTILLIVPLVLLISRRIRTSRVRRLMILLAVGLLVGVTALLLAQASSANISVLFGRFGSLGQILGNPTNDLSFQDRVAQTSVAWQSFLSAPIFGVGLGHPFGWINFAGARVSGTVIDTSVSVLAQFGLVGLVLVILAARLIWAATKTARKIQPQIALVLTAFISLVACSLLFANLFEDKGFGLALLFLLALLLLPRLLDRDVLPSAGFLHQELGPA